MDELNLTWYQYRNFTKEEVFNAKGFVYRIKDRILTLHQRKELITTSEDEIKKINGNLELLEVSKECIKYYYGLHDILV
jgi:hypothetical protein